MAMGILVLFAMLSACDRGGSSGGDDSESDRICAPGSTQACLCAGGVDGARTCDAAGTSWGNCDCGSSDTDTDTSSDSQDTSSETTDTETVDTASDSQDTDTALDTDFDDPNCPDGQWTACYGDDVWCVDVDKEPITPVEDCEDPYHCVPGTPAACDCAPEWTTRCYGGDVWWYDSCGDVDHRRTVCDTGCSVCTELSDTEAACVPLELESKQQCASGDVY